MKQDPEYGFWFWANKLDPVLSILSHLLGYEIGDEEREAIKEGMRETNDEENNWFDYTLEGEKYLAKIKLAFDDEEGNDMVHIRIKTSKELYEKLQMLNLFQSMFKKLIE